MTLRRSDVKISDMDTRKLIAFLLLMPAMALSAAADGFNPVPSSWKWISGQEAVFSFDGTYTDTTAFSYNVRSRSVRTGVSAPEKYASFPIEPEGAVNMTYSPDSAMIAFTRDNDLYVADIATGAEHRVTFDGSELILNGYASWVYYEEIFGRSTAYKAFWWSPDSRKIAFCRFDNTDVPLFPIYSPFGQDGSLAETRYPKAGETNPSVRIGIADVSGFSSEPRPDVPADVMWLDFEEDPDQYFGTPFWGPDGSSFFVSRMPRLQQSLELYSVSADDGSKRLIYRETSPTWVDWITGALFTSEGLYMSRCLDSSWQQVYFLSYDGKTFRQMTDGHFWNIVLHKVDERTGEVYFSSNNESGVRLSVYRTGKNMKTVALTDPSFDVRRVSFSPDGKYFAAAYSNSVTPVRVAVFPSSGKKPLGDVVADMAGVDFDPSRYALPEIVYMETNDGFRLPASVVLPDNFDSTGKYPVHFDIYGGPDTPLVWDRWITPNENNQWWAGNGIIQVTADCRAAGHNGRKGLDMIYRQLTVNEIKDFIAWADYMKSLPYVDGDRIGVEGFSFGGTMTAMLLFQAPESFHYGIAGGGVYDWALYDSHYTERYMSTPQDNPDGYAAACALRYVKKYPVSCKDSLPVSERPVMLKITHGTGDDNVHFQNTLQLVNALQRAGKSFELMVYPDGMHGYSGYQGRHFVDENRRFWLEHLCR